MLRTIDDVVETLRNAQASGRNCTLLIGAGCSVKAGMPTAAGFVEIIEERYPQAYRRAKEKTYPVCMAELPPGDRRDLVASYVDKAKINWAHLGIAQLMKNGFVDRILTTNFDLLTVRACALLGVFPAIYDFAASQLYSPADIPDEAVFYLHGQRTGFVLMNTAEECAKHSGLLAPVFEDAGRGRVWLVAGYSGESDPVFDHLANVDRFNHCLYWLGYRDNEPAKHVRERLLDDEKYAFYVKGFDADDFFVTLAQRLDCFPPDFASRPFSHVNQLLEMVTPYSIPGQDADVDVTEEARKLIGAAVEQYEEKPRARRPRAKALPAAAEAVSSAAMTALSHLMAGDYDKVIAMLRRYKKPLPPELAGPVAWAYFGQAIEAGRQARTEKGKDADALFALAGRKHQAAERIKPDMGENLDAWGATILEHAKMKEGDEADQLFSKAEEKLLGAESISPGTGAYNMACVSALRGKDNECLTWLEKGRELRTLPPREHMTSDPDLNSVRDRQWFKDFLSKL